LRGFPLLGIKTKKIRMCKENILHYLQISDFKSKQKSG